MQARKLKKLLNTGYIVQNCGEYAAIGSAYVHDIIKIDKQTLKIKVWQHATNDDNLHALLEKLKEIKDSGELREILDGKDEVVNPLPVFCYRGDQIIESKTDDYEWPSTDDDGYLLYENTTFKTKKDCLSYAFKDLSYSFKSISEQLDRAKEEVAWLQQRTSRETKALSILADEYAKMLKNHENFNASGENVKEFNK